MRLTRAADYDVQVLGTTAVHPAHKKARSRLTASYMPLLEKSWVIGWQLPSNIHLAATDSVHTMAGRRTHAGVRLCNMEVEYEFSPRFAPLSEISN